MHFVRPLQRSLPLCMSASKQIAAHETPSRYFAQVMLQSVSKKSLVHSPQQLYPLGQRCGFHISQRRNVHPALWLILKPVFKISAALTGRGVRLWYKRLDPKQKRSHWETVKKRWYLFAGAAAGLTGLSVFYYFSHVQETPITGRKRFMALTHDQIISISKSEAESFMESYSEKMFSPNSIESRRVMDVVMKLHKANPELQRMKFDSWVINVVNDPLVNAFVLPTGQIFVFQGMLDMARTQDELAVILGHEMAHALLDHGIEELSHHQFIDHIVIVLMAALWCVIPSDGIALVTQWFHHKVVRILTHYPHSRAVETEADRVGAMLATKACYDIRQGEVLWQKMEAVQRINSSDAALPTFLSTHPHNLKRAKFFDFIIPQAEKWREESNCPLWPKDDPREAIKVISQIADNYMTASKTGQNLKRVQRTQPSSGRAAMAMNLQISETDGDNDVADPSVPSQVECRQKSAEDSESNSQLTHRKSKECDDLKHQTNHRMAIS